MTESVPMFTLPRYYPKIGKFPRFLSLGGDISDG